MGRRPKPKPPRENLAQKILKVMPDFFWLEKRHIHMLARRLEAPELKWPTFNTIFHRLIDMGYFEHKTIPDIRPGQTEIHFYLRRKLPIDKVPDIEEFF